jgi:hypothetical protein
VIFVERRPTGNTNALRKRVRSATLTAIDTRSNALSIEQTFDARCLLRLPIFHVQKGIAKHIPQERRKKRGFWEQQEEEGVLD